MCKLAVALGSRCDLLLKGVKVIRFVLIVLFFSFSFITKAAVVTSKNVKIKEVSAYDDHMEGVVFISTSSNHPSCPDGGYLLPTAVGFKALYSQAITAGTIQANVFVQYYDNRTTSGRCEIDAIRIFF